MSKDDNLLLESFQSKFRDFETQLTNLKTENQNLKVENQYQKKLLERYRKAVRKVITPSSSSSKKRKRNNDFQRLKRIYNPEHDASGLYRHVWNSVIKAFEGTVGGFVTQQQIIEFGGVSVFDEQSHMLSEKTVKQFFEMEHRENGKFMEIKPMYFNAKKEWVVLMPDWLV